MSNKIFFVLCLILTSKSTNIEGSKKSRSKAKKTYLSQQLDLARIRNWKCPFPNCTTQTDRHQNSRHSMRYHIQTKHLDKPRCDRCEKTFAEKSVYIRHMNHIHKYPEHRPFKCEQPNCSQRFKRIDQLKAHIGRIHRGEKNYICSHCKKKYYLKIPHHKCGGTLQKITSTTPTSTETPTLRDLDTLDGNPKLIAKILLKKLQDDLKQADEPEPVKLTFVFDSQNRPVGGELKL